MDRRATWGERGKGGKGKRREAVRRSWRSLGAGMTRNNPISALLSVVSVIAFAAAAFSVIFLTGVEERILPRVAGIFVLVSTIAWRHIDNQRDRQSETHAETDASPNGLWAWVQNSFGIIGVISGLLMGYLIYIGPENLPHRKLYVAITCFTAGIGMAVSNLLPYLLKRRKVAVTPH